MYVLFGYVSGYVIDSKNIILSKTASYIDTQINYPSPPQIENLITQLKDSAQNHELCDDEPYNTDLHVMSFHISLFDIETEERIVLYDHSEKYFETRFVDYVNNEVDNNG